ncbi:sialic acid-binding Ig-like lectin 10 [Thalassophryne amazonica]|uniref:sialic acid-binding Ig-like lectin 10 n=1 Tax=Thalassophryne amazonica TaxID=390379 RepID=UPI001472026F|nr:sialic acid-binding Ig-like lectin 10 [Thalassophryne amazonica]
MIVTAASGFVVLLSVAVVQTQDDWSVTYRPTSICAPEGSTVEMPCRYTYPATWNSVSISVERRYWFVKKNKNNQPVDLRSDPEYSGRVKYLFDQNVCTLQIKNLRKTDSAEYKFRFISNHGAVSFTVLHAVTLTVTDLQVKVVSSTSNSSHTYVFLRCHSECDPPYSSFVWFNNGQKIHTGTYYYGRINPGDEIWCTLEGFEDYRSASVYAPKSSLVSVRPSGDVIEGRLVTLTCDSDAKPAATYTWYKNQNQLQGAERTYRFSSIKSGDIGSYTCRAQNQFGEKKSAPVFLNVQYAPKSSSVSVSPPGDITEGRSGESGPVSVTQTQQLLTPGTRRNENVSKQHQDPSGPSPEIRPEHSGDYYCEAQNIFGSQPPP